MDIQAGCDAGMQPSFFKLKEMAQVWMFGKLAGGEWVNSKGGEWVNANSDGDSATLGSEWVNANSIRW